MSADWGEIRARDLAGAVRGRQVSGNPDAPISGIFTDTRSLEAGKVFWALEGENFDGHDFLDQAVASGAAGVLASYKAEGRGFPPECNVILVQDTLQALGELASWWRKAHKTWVAAITGSNGKTSTKEMTAHILARKGKVLKTEGNFNNLIGLPLTLLRLSREHAMAVLEMGMNRPGEIGRLTEIAAPDAGLITNVAPAHLEGLGDLKAVARAKAELLEKMAPTGSAFLNGDDALLMSESRRFKGRLKTFGLGDRNDFRAENIRESGREGTAFEIHHRGGRIHVGLRVPGLHNVMNALAASALALEAGASESQVAEGLGVFEGIPGRLKLSQLPGGVLMVDDTYNANPSSLKAALDALPCLARDGRRTLVALGDMLELGHETAAIHVNAGRMVAEQGVDHLFIMGENADEVIRGALEAGLPADHITRTQTHEEMANEIITQLKDRDVLLLKASRGMRFDRVVERIARSEKRGDPHGRTETEKDSGG